MNQTVNEAELFGASLSNTVPARAGGQTRAQLRLPCYQLAEVELQGERKLGIILDVSSGGAFVCVEFEAHRPKPGSPLQLQVFAPGCPPVICPAHVAHLNATGIGLQFDHLASEVTERVLASQPTRRPARP